MHIDGIEKYRALFKDFKTGNFVEEIPNGLKEDTPVNFFIRALSRFTISDHMCITTDGYHHAYILDAVSEKLGIRMQRCLFHIEKDLAHRIAEEKMEDHLDMAKRMIKFMFFQKETN